MIDPGTAPVRDSAGLDTPRPRERPLVALVCRAPIVAEALAASLGGICEVMPLQGGVSDLPGLLQAIQPDGVVFDSSLDAARAADLVGAESSPVLVHVSANDAAVLLLGGQGWQRCADEASPDEVRNVLAGALFKPGAGL
jgi:hypothetical protein